MAFSLRSTILEFRLRRRPLRHLTVFAELIFTVSYLRTCTFLPIIAHPNGSNQSSFTSASNQCLQRCALGHQVTLQVTDYKEQCDD